jgi:hypothetical protein
MPPLRQAAGSLPAMAEAAVGKQHILRRVINKISNKQGVDICREIFYFRSNPK